MDVFQEVIGRPVKYFGMVEWYVIELLRIHDGADNGVRAVL